MTHHISWWLHNTTLEDNVNRVSPRNPSPRRLVRRVLAGVVGVIALMTTTMVATATPASAGRACDWFGVCGNVYNQGNLSVRITGAWRDDGLSPDWSWLLPGGSGRSIRITDVDGYYVPKNCVFLVLHTTTPYTTPYYLEFHSGWHKIRDYDQVYITKTRCYN